MRVHPHRMNFTLVAALFMLLCGIAGCDTSDKTTGHAESDPGKSDSAAPDPLATGAGRSDPLAALLENIQDASSLTLFEGLPHPTREREELKRALSQKRTVKIHRFPFYEETWVIEPQNASALKALLTSPEAFPLPPTLPPGETASKKCGVFHPDYAIHWTRDQRDYDVLICFGCAEAISYGPDAEVRRDISDGALQTLKSFLAHYERKRPRREPD